MSSYHFSLHSGHVKGSKMVEVYTHEFGGESSRELLLTYGILDEKDIINSGKEGSGGAQQQHQLLQYKQCPACSIDNKRDAKFCSGCKMVLTYDAYADTKNEAEEAKKRLEELEAKQEILQANTASVLNVLMTAEMGIKPPPVKIIAWNVNEGSEGLLKAAAIARAENEAREKEHQQKHHKQ